MIIMVQFYYQLVAEAPQTLNLYDSSVGSFERDV